MDGEQRRSAGAFHEQLADAMARRLRRDHRDVHVGAHRNRAEADVEPVREHQHVPGRQVRLDFFPVDLPLRRVGDQDHDDVGPFRDVADLTDRQPGGLSARPRAARGGQADANVHAAVLQVQRVRVALRSVADDGHVAVANERQIGIIVVIHLRHDDSLPDTLVVSLSNHELDSSFDRLRTSVVGLRRVSTQNNC
jgi:hypothetical protein